LSRFFFGLVMVDHGFRLPDRIGNRRNLWIIAPQAVQPAHPNCFARAKCGWVDQYINIFFRVYGDALAGGVAPSVM